MADTSLGKQRRLSQLADWDGHLQLLSADRPAEGRAELAATVAVTLSGQASGALLAPDQLSGILPDLDRGCAPIVVLEAGASLADGPLDALRGGASAVAMRLSWPAELPAAERAGRLDRLAMLGDECAKQGLPLLLLLDCPPADDDPALAAAVRAEQVLGAVRAVMAEDRQIDLLAAPLPADLRYVAEFAAGALDGVAREPLGALAALKTDLTALDEACRVPWLLAAEGAPEVWLSGLRLAVVHGAVGFACEGASWSDAPAEGLDEWLVGEGLHRWRRAIALSSGGRAWSVPRAAAGEADPAL